MNSRYFMMLAASLVAASAQATQVAHMSNIANNQAAWHEAEQASSQASNQVIPAILQTEGPIQAQSVAQSNLVLDPATAVSHGPAQAVSGVHRLGRVAGNQPLVMSDAPILRITYPTKGGLPQSWWPVEQVFRQIFMDKNHINPASLQGSKSDATVQAAWAHAEALWNKSPEKAAFERYKAEELKSHRALAVNELNHAPLQGIGTPYTGPHDGHRIDTTLENPATMAMPGIAESIASEGVQASSDLAAE